MLHRFHALVLLGLLLGPVIPGTAGFWCPAASAAPDPRYYRYDQILARLDAWALQYPEIFHREVIGTTGVGHEPIWAVKISDQAASHEAEPALLFHAAQHANEPNGTTATMYMIRRLLEGYGTDPYLTNFVDRLEMWFVPIVNVDGHRMAFGDLPDASDWRKTKRDNNGDGLYTCPEDGVDTNRNWAWNWAQDDAVNPWDPYFKGAYPFSEPEVNALRDLVLRLRPVILLDYHSPWQSSQGDVVFWPWMDAGLGIPAPDAPYYQDVASTLRNRLLTESGTHYGTLPGYNLLPKEQNWIYANTEACILIVEISHDGFLQGATVDTVAARVGRGSWSMMERALAGPGIAGRVTDAATGAPLVAEILVQQVHQAGVGPFLTESGYGCYWRFLSTGTYTVTVSSHGYLDETRAVHVTGGGSWSVEDFQLSRELSGGPDTREDGGPGASRGAGNAGPRLTIHSANPFAPGQAIRFAIPRAGQMRLEIFDASGRLIRALFDGAVDAGAGSVVWDGRDDAGRAVPPGSVIVRARLAQGTGALLLGGRKLVIAH